MSYEERKNILADYADGKIDIITNVGVLSEGWDAPCISIIMMARPTKSKILYIQCVGRGLRLNDNKNDCLIMDLVDVSENNSLYSFSMLEHEELVKNNNTEQRRHETQKSSPEVDNKLPQEIYVPYKIRVQSQILRPVKPCAPNLRSWRQTKNYYINVPSGTLWCCSCFHGLAYSLFVDMCGNIIFPFGSINSLIDKNI